MANTNNLVRKETVVVNGEVRLLEKLHMVIDTDGNIWMVTRSQQNINKYDIGNGIECGEYGMRLEIYNRLMRGEKIPLNTSVSFFKNCHYDGDLDFTEITDQSVDGEFEGVGYVNEQGLFIHPELEFNNIVLNMSTPDDSYISKRAIQLIETLVYFGRLDKRSIPVELRGRINPKETERHEHILNVGDFLNNMGLIMDRILKELAGTKYRIEFLITGIKWMDIEYSGMKFNPIYDFVSTNHSYDDDDGYDDDGLKFINILGMLDEAFRLIGYYVEVTELDMNHIKFQLRGHGAVRVHDIIVTRDEIKCGDKTLEFDYFRSRDKKYNSYMMIAYISLIMR